MKEKKKAPGPGVHSLPEGLWPAADRAAWQEARRPMFASSVAALPVI